MLLKGLVKSGRFFIFSSPIWEHLILSHISANGNTHNDIPSNLQTSFPPLFFSKVQDLFNIGVIKWHWNFLWKESSGNTKLLVATAK